MGACAQVHSPWVNIWNGEDSTTALEWIREGKDSLWLLCASYGLGEVIVCGRGFVVCFNSMYANVLLTAVCAECRTRPLGIQQCCVSKYVLAKSDCNAKVLIWLKPTFTFN